MSLARVIENDKRADFSLDLLRGEEGEFAVSEWLASLKNVREVIDCRKLPEWQKKDVDFLVNVSCEVRVGFERTVAWEVKTDNYPDINGTLSYEIISNFQRGTIGCALKTSADYLGFYCPQSSRLLYWKTQLLRDWVALQATSFEMIKVFNYHAGSKDHQVTLCLKIPVAQALAGAKGREVVINPSNRVKHDEELTGFVWNLEKEVDY